MGDVMSTVCYNSCEACGMTTVRFRVDMSNEDVSPFGVHVAGSFQGWDPAGTELMDPDGDMVYESIQHFDAADMTEVEFKFVNGNTWADPSETIDGACGNEYGNRVLMLDSENILLAADATGEAYCFGSCTACAPPLVVTFTVDMSMVSSVSPEGVHLAGSFQGWDPAGTPLVDNGDGTWSVSLEILPGTYEFKFINSNDWDGNEENVEGACSDDFGTRIAHFDEMNNTYTAFFNACPDAEFGCIDPAACNFDDAASVNDGSCVYILEDDCDCAGNQVDALGVCGGSCSADINGDGICDSIQTCDSIGGDFWQDLELGAFVSGQTQIVSDTLYGTQLTVGDDFINPIVLNVPVVFVDEVTGSAFQVLSWSNFSVEGLPPGVVLTLPDAVEGGTQSCIELAGDAFPTQEGLFEVVITGEVSLSLFGAPFSIGNISTSFFVEVVANPLGIPGCMYPTASNYMSWATYDSGECEFIGCTDPTALNYSSAHSIDDGSCFYDDPNCLEEAGCAEDLNGDGAVGTPDLLQMLAEFGNDCE
ncbi:MAG: hypothetical protein ACPH1A_07715 [Flavobacteriales bacterium]